VRLALPTAHGGEPPASRWRQCLLHGPRGRVIQKTAPPGKIAPAENKAGRFGPHSRLCGRCNSSQGCGIGHTAPSRAKVSSAPFCRNASSARPHPARFLARSSWPTMGPVNSHAVRFRGGMLLPRAVPCSSSLRLPRDLGFAQSSTGQFSRRAIHRSLEQHPHADPPTREQHRLVFALQAHGTTPMTMHKFDPGRRWRPAPAARRLFRPGCKLDRPGLCPLYDVLLTPMPAAPLGALDSDGGAKVDHTARDRILLRTEMGPAHLIMTRV